MSASDRNPQYFCPLRDEFINVAEADLLVVHSEAKADLPKPGEPVAQANIKAATFHNLAIGWDGQWWSAIITFDV